MPPSACRSMPSLISWGRTPAMIEWLASRTRQADRLPRVVLEAAPPEASAQMRQMDLDVLERNARDRGRGRVRGFGILRRRPHLDAVALDQRSAVHRLERRMVQKRRVVLGFDQLRRLSEGRLDVAVVACDRDTR